MKLFRSSLMETGKLILLSNKYISIPLFSKDVIEEAEGLVGSSFISGSSEGFFSSETDDVLILESKIKHFNKLK